MFRKQMKKWMLGLMAAAMLTASTGIGMVSAASLSGGMTIQIPGRGAIGVG